MKKPDPKNYVGRPMQYFNDKAEYGREIMMQNGSEVPPNSPAKRFDDWLEEKTGGLINSVPGYQFMKNTIKGAHKEKMDRLKKANYPKLKAPDVRDYYGPDGKKKSK